MVARPEKSREFQQNRSLSLPAPVEIFDAMPSSCNGFHCGCESVAHVTCALVQSSFCVSGRLCVMCMILFTSFIAAFRSRRTLFRRGLPVSHYAVTLVWSTNCISFFNLNQAVITMLHTRRGTCYLAAETLRGSFKRCKDQGGQQSRNKKGVDLFFSPRMPQTCPITLTEPGGGCCGRIC
ncbi:uncharacterized protein F5Z01DRAFT_532024 [Emericellopsis atlantica]|uniref:Transmembrane protein n=1 Tax=Emericellopsis atlantica TaxID=2614577 RepID=A0A9P7ZQI0_9HYPO|nr:uncharacterized protein F5Z01DRAFT_532024 [Emericellopsis atlantica]KAG9255982.1 hypothetical protein F5Z01DRAFT_532024 [Emericellopsis atlantica]